MSYFSAFSSYFLFLIKNSCLIVVFNLVVTIVTAQQKFDTTICAGNGVLLTVSVPAPLNPIILPPASLFEYSFDMPQPGWTTTIGGWKEGNAPFGNSVDGSPVEFNYNTYWPQKVPDHSDGYDLYLRRNIDLTGYDLSAINWYLGVDDGYILYVNGYLVSTGYAENYTYRWEYKGSIPPTYLNQGNNIVALALKDIGGLTAFDIMIESPTPKQSVLWSTGDTTRTIFVSPLESTTYYATITTGYEISRDTITVNVNQHSATSTSATICEGENYQGHTVSGTFVDTFIAANGCDSMATVQLTVLQTPVPDLGVDKGLCAGDSIVLYPGGFDTYLWQDGSTSTKFMAKQPGTYAVQVNNKCGSARDEIKIGERLCNISFPTAFTPNQDGLNDSFRILAAHDLTDYKLVVFNRWGQRVFDTNDYTKGWDGNLNGKKQPPGTFAWFCEFKKPGSTQTLKMKGAVTLIR